ncbi:MAG: hypothetical protein ACK4ZS_08485, partial [Sulfurimicrobium sp.]
MARYDASGMTISEMREFASFAACEQRYIRRSLDIALGRGDAQKRWARTGDEVMSICQQAALYAEIPMLRQLLPHVEGLDTLEPFMGPLIRLSAFDLTQGRITGFSAYRFLY